MSISRRTLLSAGLGLPALTAAKSSGIRIGVTDWNMRLGGKVEALALASKVGFEGVELSLQPAPGGDKLQLEDPDLQARYLAEAARLKIAFAGTCLLHLNSVCLVSDKLAREWLSTGIRITAKLKARVMLVPFFSKCELKTPAQIDTLVGILKDHAPAAEKAGVFLGIENYLSAQDNVRIMDRVGSKAVRVYYDVKNSTDAGFDPLKELKWLGGKRICQIHLKDKGYLGEGVVNFPEAMKIIREIGYQGFANLETAAPSGSIENDLGRNLAYIRGLM